MTKEKGRDGSASGAAVERPDRPKTDRTVQKAIGTKLRAYYDEVAKEPVPDRFVELLKRLGEQGRS